MTSDHQFYEYVTNLTEPSPADHRWSEDHLRVSFPKKSEKGFDIEVSYDPDSRSFELQTDCGYHDHLHAEHFENFQAALESVFGLVRDLLSPNMRIEETRTNGKPRKWKLQAKVNGEWVTEATTRLFIWNIFGSDTTVEYSNDVLPPRDIQP